MSTKTLSTSETKIESLKLQSSSYGVTVPRGWGVFRVPGNLVWYGVFKAVANTETQGGKGGVKTQNTTYTYTASVMVSIGHGPYTSIPRVWKGKAVYGGGVGPTQVNTVSEPAGAGASGRVYTVANAATLVGVVSVTGFGGVPLVEGVDYTRAGGAFTLFFTGFVTIVYQYTTGGVANSGLVDLGLTFIPGEIRQAVWSPLSTISPSQAIGYSGHALVAGQDYDLGTGAQVENHNFEVYGPLAWSISTSVPDADPADIALDALLNPVFGAGFPASRVGDLTAWSNCNRATGLLLSPCLTEQISASDLVAQLARLTNAAPVWSGGKLKVVPYCDETVTGNGRTYTPNLTPLYDVDDRHFLDRDAPVQHDAKAPSDRHNHHRVQYRQRGAWDAGVGRFLGQYEVDIAEAKDAADIETNGLRSAEILKAEWICDAAVARQVAENEKQRSLHVPNTYRVRLPWTFALAEPMDLLRVTDPECNLNATVLRIVEVQEGEGNELEFTLEDFPQGIAGPTQYPSAGGAGFAHDYNVAPGDVDAPVIFEAPADLATTGLEVFAAVRGSGANWGGCQVWVSLDGTTYRQTGVVRGGSRYGTLSAAMGATAPVQGLGSAQLLSGSSTDAAALQTLCWVGPAAQEYFAYETATLTGPGAYTLGNLVRGAYGTASAAHASGQHFVRVDDRLARSGALDPALVGQTVSFKFCSFNVYGGAVQGLADVPAYTYTVTGAMLNIPPADVAGFTVEQIPTGVRMKWGAQDDVVFDVHEEAVWSDATPPLWTGQATVIEMSWPSAGSHTYLIKARKTKGGARSQTAASATVLIDGRVRVTDTVITATSTTTGSSGSPGASTRVGAWQGPDVPALAGDQLDITVRGKHRETFWSLPASAEVEVWLTWSATFGGLRTEVPGTRRRFNAAVAGINDTTHFQIDAQVLGYAPGAGTRFYQGVYEIRFRDAAGAAQTCAKDFGANADWSVVVRQG